MSLGAIILLVLGLGFVAWLSARARAAAFAGPSRERPHSLPNYHGWYVALWAVVPALIFVAFWAFLSDRLVADAVLSSPQAAALPAIDMQRAAILAEARGLATGAIDSAHQAAASALAPVYARAISFYAWLGLAVALLLAFAGGAWSYTRLSPSFRARTRVERIVMALLLTASLIAILTTLGIFLSLLFCHIQVSICCLS